MQAVEAFCQFYQKLDAQSASFLPTIYADKIIFIDPVSQHNGIDAVIKYFDNLLSNTTNCTFDITRVSSSNDVTYVTWIMHFSHPKLASNKLISVHGITELQIEHNKIVYHRDYYDMGEMLYENVPLLGRIVRWLKQRLAN